MTLKPTKEAANKDNSMVLQTLAFDYKKTFEREMFADIELQTKDGSLKANKTILSIRSPVFNAILSKDWQVSSVDVQDFDSKTMKEVLRFIYYNEVEDLKLLARDLIYAAEKFDIEGLKKLCLNNIIESLSTENVVESLIISDRIKAPKLFTECLELINR